MSDRLRIYADTSVFGGLYDPEFTEGSARFLELVNQRAYELVVSELMLREIAYAPPHIRDLVRLMLPLCSTVSVTPAAERLGAAYLDQGVLSAAHQSDALHVAMATVSACHSIVSWNFRHIVNYRRVPLFNAVNVLHGYNEIGIFTPHAVLGDDETD